MMSSEDDYEPIDLSQYKKHKQKLERLSFGRYEMEFRRDWKAYLKEVFRFEGPITEYVKPLPLPVKKEIHPFNEWI